ncbi:zinc finger protein 184-like [Physella acuta]|uniref:zinc finger protein 184-like n=1 Tax=Physella acuta TaxID=109671 RepID=UPI0027DBA589|nr:zinc finger protein 184-like [Physella acuta]XP_059176966.1 zinc finger protein 184-like [Physella acuta]XP_059176967.1 zinc finger protein 184-like [Physella acuta]
MPSTNNSSVKMEFPIEMKPDILNIPSFSSESMCDIKNKIKSEIIDDKSFFFEQACFNELQTCVEAITYRDCLKYGNTFTCNLCNKRYISMKSFETHLMRHLSGKSQASLAQMESILESRGKRNNRHVFKNIGSKEIKPAFICDVCGKSYICKSSLEIHYARHTKLKNYDCYKCRQVFYNAGSLKEHIFLHSVYTNSFKSGLPVVCDLCNQHLNKMDCIKKHMQKHLTEKPQPKKISLKKRKRKRPCICDICGKIYSCDSLLKQHYVVHTKVKLYLCDVCGKSYASKTCLNNHYKLHSNSMQKKYTCVQCGSTFLNIHCLYKHRRLHIKVKAHKCNECDKTFSIPAYLRIHIRRVHTKDNPFPCEHCDKSFFFKSMLNRHLAVHTTAQPFLCTICGKLFKRKTSLRDHFLRHKKRNQVPDD